MLCCGSGPKQTTPYVYADEASGAGPAILSDEKSISLSTDLRGRFANLVSPVSPSPDEATVNLSAATTSADNEHPQPSTSYAGDKLRAPSEFYRRVKSIRPPAAGLNWTESRRMLEVKLTGGASFLGDGDYGWPGLVGEEQRLRARLRKLNLDMFVMEGDGNCQFRAASFGLYGVQDYHAIVRRKAIKYMRNNKHEFAPFLGEDIDVYLDTMARNGVWGDELTLRAICEAYGVVINVVTSEKQNWFLRYMPKQTVVQLEIFLTYISPVHYNAIRRQTSMARVRSIGRRGSEVQKAMNKAVRLQSLREGGQEGMPVVTAQEAMQPVT